MRHDVTFIHFNPRLRFNSLLDAVCIVRNIAFVKCYGIQDHTCRHRGSRPDKKTFDIPASLAPQSHALLTEAKRWIGTPYRYGGEDRNGVDCSGLVLNVYRSALQLKLPRNSAAQADFCKPLSKAMLMPGDLIFFDTAGGGGKKISHVGIYVGDGMMIHSSSSKGVIVSDINADYFKRTFAGAGYVEKYRDMIASNTPKPSPAQQPSKTPVR